MIVEWSIPYDAEVPEWLMQEMIKYIRDYNLDEAEIKYMIDDMLWRLDREYYEGWNDSATEQVYEEIQRRLIGVQLSMFDSDSED
jgi:hypothetical protein